MSDIKIEEVTKFLSEHIGLLVTNLKGEIVDVQKEFNNFINVLSEKNRRTGRTNRLVNSYIEELFQKGKIENVVDHWMFGTHNAANDYLFNLIMQRLSNEYKNILNDIAVNRDTRSITFIKGKYKK